MKFNLGLGCVLAGVALAGCKSSGPVASGTTGGAGSKPALTKLGTDDIKVGTGPPAEVGDTVYMEYKGELGNGVVFDTNVPADPSNPEKAPFSFQLVREHPSVIAGWNQGIVGMKAGGERKLSIPWSLAYGEDGKAPIPPKADLFFDVKLLAVIKAGHESDLGETEVKLGSGREVKKGDWVTITYAARLMNGLYVDDSYSHAPGSLQFQAGTGERGGGEFVPISGVVHGVIGMKQGGERILTLPPSLADNPAAHQENVPPGSMFRFDVQLLRVSDKKGPDLAVQKPSTTKS